ncbi:hypothetical protein CSC17_3901 [Klebsiella oxytoca]|nr:hypothetical protein CSC17_3901 [Klebsiella oxytoca]
MKCVFLCVRLYLFSINECELIFIKNAELRFFGNYDINISGKTNN